jgi:hypothetical protein
LFVKGSLKLRPRRVLTRSEAWACFTANLALAGSGSLAAGRAVGYAQMAASFLAMILSFISAVPFIQWALSNGGVPQSPMGDPFQGLGDLWYHARWPLASIGLYAVSVLWAMMTSRSILAEAAKGSVPPVIPIE